MRLSIDAQGAMRLLFEMVACGRVTPEEAMRCISAPESSPEPEMSWCPVHLKWETREEDIACDDELYRQGYRNVGGVPLKLETPNPSTDPDADEAPRGDEPPYGAPHDEQKPTPTP